jgi:hypothetical protein
MPRMKMTPLVRLSLYGLVLYLFVMMAVITVGFVRTARSGHMNGGIPVSQPAPRLSY